MIKLDQTLGRFGCSAWAVNHTIILCIHRAPSWICYADPEASFIILNYGKQIRVHVRKLFSIYPQFLYQDQKSRRYLYVRTYRAYLCCPWTQMAVERLVMLYLLSFFWPLCDKKFWWHIWKRSYTCIFLDNIWYQEWNTTVLQYVIF